MPKHRKRKYSTDSDSHTETRVKRQIRKLSRLLERRAEQRAPPPAEASIDAAFLEVAEDQNASPTLDQCPLAGPADSAAPPLGDEILKILGYDPQPKPEEAKIHDSIADVWSHILRQGLSPDQKETLIHKYPAFANCQLMEAPKINPEVNITISEATLARDTRLAHVQDQIRAAMTSLGRALTLVLDEPSPSPEKFVEFINDSARLFADIHHEHSQTRRALLKNTLNKSLTSTLTEIPPDGWLFGTNLTERIKAAKALDKTSEALKIAPPSKTSLPPRHLNYKGPPRQPQQQPQSQRTRRRGGPKQPRPHTETKNTISHNRSWPYHRKQPTSRRH